MQDDGQTAVIDINGYIGKDWLMEWITGKPSENTVENLKKQLREISASKIIVNINSGGGDLNDGLYIKNMLQQKGAEVVTNTYGFSASAATVIGQAGGTRRISEDAFLLIHRCMFGLCGYYNQNTFRSLTESGETIDNQLIKMYAKKSMMNEAEVAELMDEGEGYGRWVSAEEALELGLVDEVFDPSDEADGNVDRMDPDQVESMKQNVRSMAIQGFQSSQEFKNWIKSFEKESNQEEANQKPDSALEARNRFQLLKHQHEV